MIDLRQDGVHEKLDDELIKRLRNAVLTLTRKG